MTMDESKPVEEVVRPSYTQVGTIRRDGDDIVDFCNGERFMSQRRRQHGHGRQGRYTHPTSSNIVGVDRIPLARRKACRALPCAGCPELDALSYLILHRSETFNLQRPDHCTP